MQGKLTVLSIANLIETSKQLRDSIEAFTLPDDTSDEIDEDLEFLEPEEASHRGDEDLDILIPETDAPNENDDNTEPLYQVG